ncbi:MAG: hypothetical protein KKC29_15665 [Alphaproteobacteria bacterium]|nr:hypothetical protein [Alphaproteobacteria bacterium]MBU2041881.1 hypothetical protein [Alphaproteobacteria bacterium]MBU2125820.1 hypothetical protein [Alphaproteobacteria bacterium]MBU2292529.1 hypothetical protein [Alphaproteobacteria bacterium]MBU2397705.1 hypothetical protein [Alphaproteobacteria bacterium]
MTATDLRRSGPRQTGMKSLAGGLAFVCLVLFLLAIEQKHAVAAWTTLREEAVPAARRVADWTGQMASGEAGGLGGLKSALADDDNPRTAGATDTVLAGEFGPADETTRAALGGAVFAGAGVRFDTGDSFRTAPLRIAAGREYFVFGQTFADRLDAPADAQIELRRILPATRGEPVRASALCGGEAPALIALLHRRDRVDLMLFRAPARPGPDAPVASFCGAWRLKAR